MPGIASIISKSYNRSFDSDIYSMIGCMLHESFYTSNIYVNKQAGIYVGAVSRKGSFTDCMPVWNEKKDSCLFFSGEDFSGSDTLEQLKSRGHEFDSSNSGYIIHLYEEKDEEFIDQLNGAFSGVVFDIAKEKILLFNDRYGMQRIYFHENDDAFYFSSEAKSLLKVIPGSRALDYQSLGELMSCGCVLENRTLFSKISLLPCASKWTFRNGCIEKREQYFKFSDWENTPRLDIDTYYRRLKGTFGRILPRYFRSREPIGISLTGGLDTRMIMAHMERQPGRFTCYTFGGMYRDSADVTIARKVANACFQPYQVIRVDRRFLSEFPMLAEKTVYLTDGNLDVSGSPDLYANGLARGIAPIRMTGNYGSEVLRRNVAFKPSPPSERLFHPDFYKHVQHASNTYAAIRMGHPLSFIVGKQVPWHHYGRLSLEQSQVTMRSPFLDNDLVRLVYQAPDEAMDGWAISHRLIGNGNPALSKISTDRGVGGNSNFLFRKSSEVFRNFTFKAEYAYDYGMPQWVAKLDNILKPFHLERLFLGRHKFYHFRTWYRNELSGYVRDTLLDIRAKNRPYLNSKFLVKIIDDHVKGKGNYTTEIHKILSAELIHRTLIEQ